jgi:hypothetical protein
MSRRILGALTCAGLVAGAAAAQLITPRQVEAAQCSAPHVSSVTNALAHAGDVITVAGTGFTCGGQGNGTSLTVGGTGQHITALGDSQIQFQASGSAGSVVVTVSYPVLLGSQTVSSNTERLLLMAPSAQNATATPGPGGTFTVGGSGFSLGGFVKTIGAVACGNGMTAGLASDTALTLTAPGSYCNGPITLGFIGYATSTKNSTIITNTVTMGGGSLDVSPSVGGLSSASGAPGQSVSLSGAGFGTGGSATLNGVAVPSSWSDTSISFTVQPDDTSGTVVFTRADGHQIDGGGFTVNSTISGVSPGRAQPGDTVTISGAGFGPSTGSVTLGGTGLAVKSWSPTSIVATIPAGAPGGDITVTPKGNAASTRPGAVAMVSIAGVSPGDGAPGATIGITGAGFGSQKGSVTIGGVAAPVTIWGDSTIAVKVPSIPSLAASGGPAEISVSVPGAPSALTTAFKVDPVPPPPTPGSTPGSTPGNTPGSTPGNTPGSTPGSTSNPTAGSTPGSIPTFIPPSGDGPIISIGPVPFKPAPQVQGPVNLVLAASKLNAEPGTNVPITVTLSAFGKPVVGAPVDLILVVVPGGDASISPTKGVTDSAGKMAGVLHLSERAGQHIILAKSGDYSDEIQVTGNGLTDTAAGGTSPDSGIGGALTGGSPQRTIIVAALLACLVLFLSGFGINVATARRGGAAAVAIGPRRSLAGTMLSVPVNAGAAAQFGVAMMVCSIGQLVAVLRRR